MLFIPFSHFPSKSGVFQEEGWVLLLREEGRDRRGTKPKRREEKGTEYLNEIYSVTPAQPSQAAAALISKNNKSICSLLATSLTKEREEKILCIRNKI